LRKERNFPVLATTNVRLGVGTTRVTPVINKLLLVPVSQANPIDHNMQT
jgi:hypothetical protein